MIQARVPLTHAMGSHSHVRLTPVIGPDCNFVGLLLPRGWVVVAREDLCIVSDFGDVALEVDVCAECLDRTSGSCQAAGAIG
jgi:hypothetical protein